jgi:hypothetical protein
VRAWFTDPAKWEFVGTTAILLHGPATDIFDQRIGIRPLLVADNFSQQASEQTDKGSVLTAIGRLALRGRKMEGRSPPSHNVPKNSEVTADADQWQTLASGDLMKENRREI